MVIFWCIIVYYVCLRRLLRCIMVAFVAQLGERMTEDHKVRGSIPRGGIFFTYLLILNIRD